MESSTLSRVSRAFCEVHAMMTVNATSMANTIAVGTKVDFAQAILFRTSLTGCMMLLGLAGYDDILLGLVEEVEQEGDVFGGRQNRLREDCFVELGCVADDELERDGTGDEPVQREVDSGEHADVGDVLKGTAEHLTRGLGDRLVHGSVGNDNLTEEVLGDDFDDLDLDADVGEVQDDEVLEVLGDCFDVLAFCAGGHLLPFLLTAHRPSFECT